MTILSKGATKEENKNTTEEETIEVEKKRILICVLASLSDGESVRPSVCPSVGWSVTHDLNL